VRDALEYAYDNGVSVVISNSDLNSFHHNSPNHNNHAIAVHAIVHDKQKAETSSTFFNYNSCTNYGSNLMFSVSANGCSSEASGRAGGMLGLLYAAALKANVPQPYAMAGDPDGNRRLTAEEVRQLFITTVDSFYNPEDALNPLKFPTKQGFARRFGYGRPNPRTAIDALLSGKIPPEVDLTGPLWFDVMYPDKTPKVTIEGRVAVHGAAQNPAGTTFDWVLEWAPGVDPDDSQFKEIAKADMLTGQMEGKLADFDISNITVNNPVPLPTDKTFQPDDPVNIYTITMRLRATINSSNPNLNGAKGESRKAFHIYRDSDLLPGFPKFVGSSGESSPKLADLDGDGKREIILADSAGRVHAYKADGSELAGWPVKTELLPLLDPATHKGAGHAQAPGFKSGKLNPEQYSPVGASPGIGDIDGDGKPEVVVATWNGYVWAYKADGKTVAGFPVELKRDSRMYTKGEEYELEDGFWAAPVLVDLDGDNKLEIVQAGMDARLYAWKGDGKEVAGFPVLVQDVTIPDPPAGGDTRQRQRIMTTPAAGDLNGDNVPDFVLGTNENYSGHGRVYAVDGRGNGAPGGAFLPGFPIDLVSTRFLPVVAQGVPISPALGDIDGDKVPEILISGLASVPRIFNSKGRPFGKAMVNTKERYGAKSNAMNSVFFTFVSFPAFGDLDDDGDLDVIEGGAGTDAALAFASGGERRDFEHHMGAWDAKTGLPKSGYPRVMEDWQFFSTPAIADIDGDGKVNVIAGSGGYFIHGWDVDGVEAKGFPKFTGGWVLSTPTVGDLDGDGKLEMVANTRAGWLFAWRTEGKADGRTDWTSFHHDLRNTGNYDVALDFGKRAEPVAPGGCSCDVGRGARSASGALLALGLLAAALVLRRRARS
jgi:MYXO-CTERM domain-containing protein